MRVKNEVEHHVFHFMPHDRKLDSNREKVSESMNMLFQQIRESS